MFAFWDTGWPGAAKVVEESSELTKELALLMMTGGDPQHWTGNVTPRIEDEIADLMASLETFVMLNPDKFNEGRILRRKIAKKQKFLDWRKEKLENPDIPIQQIGLNYGKENNR